jgi:hypothetical protein
MERDEARVHEALWKTLATAFAAERVSCYVNNI